jgi:uncharacterized protein
MSTGKRKKPEKITVDTNILVSGLIYPGKTVVNIFDDIFDGEVMLGISEDLIKEFIRVCIIKFEYDPGKTMDIVRELRGYSQPVAPVEVINVIKDEPDNRVLECAVTFKADCIISGDRHLLDLKKYKGIEIITPADYIKKYG